MTKPEDIEAIRTYRGKTGTEDLASLIPPPSITITANPGTLPVGGGTTTLTWDTTNTPDGGVFIDHGIGWVDANGSTSASILNTTVFTASAYNESGSDSDSVTVYVEEPVNCSWYNDPAECVAEGCWWYDGSCHGTPECSPDGKQECRGYDLFECIGGSWIMVEQNSPQCGPECSPDGIMECRGYDLYKCQNGEWVLVEENSPTCGWYPPPCSSHTTESDCIGAGCYWCDGVCQTTPCNGNGNGNGTGCSQYTSQPICEAAGCHWYAPFPNPLSDPVCQEKPWYESYLPLIIGGAAGVILIAALATGKPKTYYAPPRQEKQY